ncbi:hypothetical protein B0H14DRAFT_3514938 [Mycena olivaceomarginata]|nr:hypothetical protein B0H14DRAFT_3514938 [Mycena olivaceomarginata]
MPTSRAPPSSDITLPPPTLRLVSQYLCPLRPPMRPRPRPRHHACPVPPRRFLDCARASLAVPTPLCHLTVRCLSSPVPPHACHPFHAHVAPSPTTVSALRALMPPLASASSHPLPGLPSSHTRPPRLSIVAAQVNALRRLPRAPPCGSLRTLPTSASLLLSASALHLPSASGPTPAHANDYLASLLYNAPHACVRMRLLSFCIHTPLRYDRAYHLTLPSTRFLWFPHPAPPRCVPQDYNSTAIAILSYLAIPLLAARVTNSLPPPPPPDPSHLGFQVCRLTLGLMGLDDTAETPEEPVWAFGGRMAYCPQTSLIQNASLRDNMLSGRLWDEDKYWRMMEDACLVPDLHFLADGDLTEWLILSRCALQLHGAERDALIDDEATPCVLDAF